MPTETSNPRLRCPLCGASDYEGLKRFDDGVEVGRCAGCGLLYTPLRHVSPEKVLAPTTVEALRNVFAPILRGERSHNRARNFREYLGIVARHAPGRRLLDVGCAHGFLGREARGAGFTVTGVEPNAGMAAFAAEVNGLEILEGTLESVDLASRTFDAVTFTDSLEYVPDPVGALRKVAEHLAARGIVFLKVPNGRSFLLRHRLARFGVRGGGGEPFSPSRRVVHYTRQTLAAVAEAAGLEPIEAGEPRPVHSPPRHCRGETWVEVEPRWHEALAERAARAALHHIGRLESALLRRNDLSPSLYVVARRGD